MAEIDKFFIILTYIFLYLTIIRYAQENVNKILIGNKCDLDD